MGYLVKNPQVFPETQEVALRDPCLSTKTAMWVAILSIDMRNVSITASFVGLAFERENGRTRATSEGGALEASIVCSA
jgi:hypothetical protein